MVLPFRLRWILSPLLVLIGLVAGSAGCRAQSFFSDRERAKIVAYWAVPGRHVITAAPPEPPGAGPWQVRLTADGSAWFLAYQKVVSGNAKPPPTLDARAPVGATGMTSSGAQVSTAGWETWVQVKLAHDRAAAQATADRANAAALGRTVPNPAAPPPPLGPIPPTLLAACGNPPPFADAVTPLRHVVTFENEPEPYVFADNVRTRERYAYYRFPQGTVAYGTPLREMPGTELDSLFAAAGMTPAEQRIARAVSKLEGGFETVNTYDTGYVSIGFIQFITGEEGRGSLSQVLAREKTDRPNDFAQDFHRFGIDVDPFTGTLIVCDPSTGAELWGAPAVQKIIADKRLAAVFQRAGRKSLAFRVAQIQLAKARYWPADEPIKIVIKGREMTGKVSDVVRSEAGLATLFDRKVNRGTIAPFADVLTRVMTARGGKTLADAAKFEREIIAQLKYRADFLADPTLSKPK